MGNIVGLPFRILTLNRKTRNHQISDETLEKLQTYLEENDITDVYVAVNEYDPKGQWKRLCDNNRIAPFWRYSAGTIAWIGYAVFPNRVFGGDSYNPYTNSLSLTSDVPALVLAEAACAKDIHSQRYPGTYAGLFYDLPVLSAWRRVRATSDVLAYARAKQDWDSEKQAYHVLYPYVGSVGLGPAGHFVPVVGPFLYVGGALIGHATGRTVVAVLESQSSRSSSDNHQSPAIARADKKSDVGALRRSGGKQSAGNQGDVVQAGFQESNAARSSR